MTVQAQILDLLQDLQREFNSAVIIITHDLGVIAEMADDVAGDVRRSRGRVRLRQGDPDPPGDALHLGSAVAASRTSPRDTDARLIPIPGNPPSLLSPPTGCAFHPRCAHKDKVPGDLCATDAARADPRHPR